MTMKLNCFDSCCESPRPSQSAGNSISSLARRPRLHIALQRIPFSLRAGAFLSRMRRAGGTNGLGRRIATNLLLSCAGYNGANRCYTNRRARKTAKSRSRRRSCAPKLSTMIPYRRSSAEALGVRALDVFKRPCPRVRNSTISL